MAELMNPTAISWRDYLALCKPRVVLLMLVCAVVGMLLATETPADIPLEVLIFGIIGIALVASSAASVNHIAESHIDAQMTRTQSRPLVLNRLSFRQAVAFSAVTGIMGMTLLLVFTNQLTALLNLISWVGYGFIYTLFLKHATSQNIVIGGLFGAAPPLFGWAAVTNTIEPGALLLVLIIFTWTPPHFWALALDRKEEYQKANLPMLPVTHGETYTRWFILLYTLLLVPISLLPFAIGMNGPIYFSGALMLGLRFLYLTIKLVWGDSTMAMPIFRYSITYLFLLFALLLLDHYLGFEYPPIHEINLQLTPEGQA